MVLSENKKSGSNDATAAARKIAVIIWNMLTEDAGFDTGKMTGRGLKKKSSDMSVLAAAEAAAKEKPAKRRTDKVKTTGVAGKNRKKAGERPVSWFTFYRRRSDEQWSLVGACKRPGEYSCE
jgi:hypothetical protein